MRVRLVCQRHTDTLYWEGSQCPVCEVLQTTQDITTLLIAEGVLSPPGDGVWLFMEGRFHLCDRMDDTLEAAAWPGTPSPEAVNHRALYEQHLARPQRSKGGKLP